MVLKQRNDEQKEKQKRKKKVTISQPEQDGPREGDFNHAGDAKVNTVDDEMSGDEVDVTERMHPTELRQKVKTPKNVLTDLKSFKIWLIELLNK